MRQILVLVILVNVLSVAAVLAQSDGGSPVAYVTAVSGEGATRGSNGAAFTNEQEYFSDRNSGLSVGESVVTGEDGAAVLFFPEYQIVAHLSGGTELQVSSASGLRDDVRVALNVVRGRAQIVRSSTDKRWLLIQGGTAAQLGYTLSQGGSLVVEASSAEVSFAVVAGRAFFFSAGIPGGALIGADRMPIDATGKELSVGQRVSTLAPAGVGEEAEMAHTAFAEMNHDLFAFAVQQSGQWVESAEKGDFTPVRPEAAGAAQAFNVQVGIERQSFDQPRQAVTTPVTRATVSTLQAQVNVAQRLLGSGIPSSVVIGQRIRRSRIIGNPGTAGTGQLRFNPFAEQLIRLAGRPGRR